MWAVIVAAFFDVEENIMAKRINGEGTIYKRADGRWCAAYYVGCKRKFLYGKSQKEVKYKLKALMEEEKENEQLTDTGGLTLQSWVFQYLKDYKVNEIKASTMNTYMTFYRKHIEDSDIGEMELQEIQTNDLQRYYNRKLKDGLSAKTVRHLSVIIREALTQAVRLRYIRNSPQEGVILPKKEKYEGKTLSQSDVLKLLNSAGGEALYPLIMTAIFTGMRKGEILGLQWKNVDLENGYIKVEKSLCRVADSMDEKGRYRTKLVLLEPKTVTSKRIIPITSQLVDILEHHRERQEEYKREAIDFYNSELDLVFANYLGGFMSEREVLRGFYTVLDKYEIPRVRFHDLRHTYASLLMESETDSKVIQELLGHSSISTTLDIYTHLKMGQKRSSIDKMAGMFMENSDK